MVNHTTLAMLLLPMALAQDDVQVDCTPDHMEIRVTKAVVDTMGFASADVHLEEPDCKFGEIDDGQFYIYRMSPLTACGTEVKLNGTHVEYKNKLIAGNDQSVLEKGAVIVGTADSSSRQALAAKLKCLFPIELMVSTAFLPNISHVTIPLPPAYGIGKFMASMQLFKTEFYEQPYQNNPELTTADYLNVETRLLGNFTDDIFIRMQRCWATPTEDSQSETSFNLLEDGCASEHAADQGLAITVNGDEVFGRFRAPVFKFVKYTAVWLHCDLQICIRDTCQPMCAAEEDYSFDELIAGDDAEETTPIAGARRRRSSRKHRRALADTPYGPADWDESHLISIGPLMRIDETLEIEIIEEAAEESFEDFEPEPTFTPFHVAVLSALIAVSALCITLACFLCKKPQKQ